MMEEQGWPKRKKRWPREMHARHSTRVDSHAPIGQFLARAHRTAGRRMCHSEDHQSANLQRNESGT